MVPVKSEGCFRKPLVYWLGSQTNMFYDAIEDHKTLKLNNRLLLLLPLDEKFPKTAKN